jgi:hypothetical protein
MSRGYIGQTPNIGGSFSTGLSNAVRSVGSMIEIRNNVNNGYIHNHINAHIPTIDNTPKFRNLYDNSPCHYNQISEERGNCWLKKS